MMDFPSSTSAFVKSSIVSVHFNSRNRYSYPWFTHFEHQYLAYRTFTHWILKFICYTDKYILWCCEPTTDLWPVIGGSLRASGMVLQYKPPGSLDLQELHMETADDKRVASAWLAAMHKVGCSECVHCVIFILLFKCICFISRQITHFQDNLKYWPVLIFTVLSDALNFLVHVSFTHLLCVFHPQAAKLLYESRDQWNDTIKHNAGHREARTEQKEGENIAKPSIVLFSLTCTLKMLVRFLFNPLLLLPVKTDPIYYNCLRQREDQVFRRFTCNMDMYDNIYKRAI